MRHTWFWIVVSLQIEQKEPSTKMNEGPVKRDYTSKNEISSELTIKISENVLLT